MPFINDIIKYKSLAITGLEKNTGKTECLNYILKRLENTGKKIAATSIGVDGEKTDQIYRTSKPEVELYRDFLFSTSEQHYKIRKLTSEIIDVSHRFTALGRLITARTVSPGKIILSGPHNTEWLKNWSDQMLNNFADITIVDGAFSRLSHASPAISNAMILNTGANVSTDMNKLLSKTKFIVELINNIDEFNTPVKNQLIPIERGIWAINENNVLTDLEIPSVLMIEKYKNNILKHGKNIYAPGVITDKLLDFLRIQNHPEKTVLIAKDFTKLFFSVNSYRSYLNSGAKLKVLLKTNLIAVCVNPVSVTGFSFDTNELCQKMSEAIKMPVHDIMKI